MMRSISMACLVVLSVLPLACAAQEAAPDPVDPGEPYRDSGRWQSDIDRFQTHDAEHPQPAGAVVCVGSSSMRFWHDDIAEDLAPLTLIPRGFGGSNMNDLLHYVDELVITHRPRAVLIYEGDNDIHQGVAPHMVAQTFERLVAHIHAELPGCRVYLLAIKPSPRRWELWPQMQQANELLLAVCEQNERLTFIDIASPMLGEDGQPRAELYVDDRLHMSRAGYVVWREAVRPALVENERRFE